jgi:ABC-type sugar transport system ATPase subunit
VSLSDVTKRYPKSKSDAVKKISFDVEEGELLVILGPSGCGKTSTLRMIAGLESVTSGSISFDGRRVNDVPPARRNVAMAFENYGLYEHWTVFDNIAYPLHLAGQDHGAIERQVRGNAEKLQLTEYLDERPRGLSGGSRQRVGLARALVRQPSVFLLDEPMSHVDAELRNDMRAEIKRIHLEVASTMIIVTHDQLDALTLADRVLVMEDGNISQHDTPENVYATPANTFVAGFVGEPPMNMVPAQPGWTGGDDVRYGFRPHRVAVTRPDEPAPAGLAIEGTVYMVEPLGDRTLVTVSLRHGSGLIKADLVGSHSFSLDQPVRLVVDEEHVHAFDTASGQRLSSVHPSVAAPA